MRCFAACRTVADQSDAVLVGETYTDSAAELKEYYGAHNDEIQLPMDFMFCTHRQAFRARIPQADCARRIHRRLADLCHRQSRYAAILSCATVTASTMTRSPS